MTQAPIPGPEAPSLPPGRGWMRFLLVASLALNLAVLGVLGGAMLRSKGEGTRTHATRDLGFGPFAEALTDEDRKALRRAFITRAPDLRDARRAMREDAEVVLNALRADPFQPDVLRDALTRGTGRAQQRQEIGQALIFDHVQSMTPKMRRDFADRLENSLTRKGPRQVRTGTALRP